MDIELKVYRKVTRSGRLVERKVFGMTESRVHFWRSDRIDDRPYRANIQTFRRWMKGATTCPTPQ